MNIINRYKAKKEIMERTKDLVTWVAAYSPNGEARSFAVPGKDVYIKEESKPSPKYILYYFHRTEFGQVKIVFAHIPLTWAVEIIPHSRGDIESVV